jgi:hypothetical protein
MSAAYIKRFIEHVLAHDPAYIISVWDGEEWQVRQSRCPKLICDAIASVDEAELRIRDSSVLDDRELPSFVGWALIINGLDWDEALADYTDNPTMRLLVDGCDKESTNQPPRRAS